MSDLFPINEHLKNLCVSDDKHCKNGVSRAHDSKSITTIDNTTRVDMTNIDIVKCDTVGVDSERVDSERVDTARVDTNLNADENSIKLEKFPFCARLRGYYNVNEGTGYICVKDAFVEIEYTGGSKSNMSKIMKHSIEKGYDCKKLIINCDWNRNGNCWDPRQHIGNSPEKCWCVNIKNLKPFLLNIANRSRKRKNDKIKLLKKFNIELSKQEESNIKVPIETELIELLSNCSPFSIKTSYKVDNHYIDAFIPRLRLAIMIDEYGHRNYDENEEKEYNTLIRDHNMILFRFNPHEKYIHSAAEELVKRIWSLSISPEVQAFKEKNKL